MHPGEIHLVAEATTPIDLAKKLSDWSSMGYRHMTERPGEVIQATVIDSFSHFNSYIIAAPFFAPTAAFLSSGDSSLLPVGVKGHGTLIPGTQVLAWFPPDSDWAVILGTRGNVVASRNLDLPYSIVPASRSGLFDDLVHNFLPFSGQESPGPFNASAGRPVDVLPGEWGQSNELGLMIHLGRTMALLRASETAGISFHCLDDLTRLWGYNLELLTAGSERYAHDDEGEFTDREGLTPFPWEALGAFKPETKATATAEDGALRANQESISLEPAQKDQMPIWRRQDFKGFLGSIRKTIVQVPDIPTGDEPESLSRKDIYAGLLDIQEGIDGRYSVRSAKEITFEKIALIPAPKQEKLPADPTGDHKNGFNASGRNWSGLDPDAVVGDLKEFEFNDDLLSRAAQVFDYHAYLYNVYGVQGFRIHPKDWNFPDEEEIKPTESDFAGSVNDNIEPTDNYRMELPQIGDMVIDHRTKVKYYKTRSLIKQLDNGGILIEDGWGSQIRMEGGHVTITSPLDIIVQPGRSLIGMAPNDVIMRAGNSLDATAAKGDLRLKAERNLHALAGNSEEGGMLLESKGRGAPGFRTGEDMVDGGITLKAVNSDVRVSGQEVRVESNVGDILLAAPGRNVRVLAAEFLAKVTDARIEGTLSATAILTSLFNTASALTLTDSNGDSVVGLVYAGQALLNHAASVTQAAQLDTEIKNAEFSMRTPAQYQLEEGTFVWFEHRWQQIYRDKAVGQKWDEPDITSVVAAETTKTLPYPGKELWDEKEQFRTIDTDLFDLGNGRSKPFSAIKDKNKGPDAQKATLADGYLVSKQGRA